MYVFNSMEQKVQYVEIYLDSRDSVKASQDYLKTDWALFRLERPLYDIVSMKVLDVQIPASNYLVNYENNSFYLTEKGVPFQTITVTLPEGNYNSSTLVTALAAALNNASFYGWTYTVTFSNTTQKLSISANNGNFDIYFNDNDTNYTNSLQFYLGMEETNSSVPQPPFGLPGVLVAPYTVKLTGPDYLYVCSDTLGGLFQTYLPDQYALPTSRPQIAKVPINVDPNNVTFYNDPAPEKWFTIANLAQLQQFDLYMTLGNTARKIRFNGQSFCVKLGALIKEK